MGGLFGDDYWSAFSQDWHEASASHDQWEARKRECLGRGTRRAHTLLAWKLSVFR
jgi:hypothetical protein